MGRKANPILANVAIFAVEHIMIRALAAASLLLALVVAENTTPARGFTTVAQCKCSDMEECGATIKAKTSRCKKSEKCTAFLSTIGDAAKIMQCLDKDHEVMNNLEECAKKKLNGELGCTNSDTPVNVTIPLIPVIEVPSLEESAAAAGSQQTPSQPSPPLGLSQYLMCVDECALDDMEVIPGRKKRSPVNCAFKLKCALTPPSDAAREVYAACEKELKYDPKQGAADSCRCLQQAGVNMQCS
ncbi:unnamed protein product [Caenorhabditis auriculariae]|uniref:Uncharacterized protein n=1 Tax=Caenorhabditis auriculariae TaxID=2777116 RepID=A0A8S1H1V7_9PELO|nr:unnamed protein product [Caenorhabditis auriculariae]